MFVLPAVKTAIGLLGVRLQLLDRRVRHIHIGKNRVKDRNRGYTLIVLCTRAAKRRDVDSNLPFMLLGVVISRYARSEIIPGREECPDHATSTPNPRSSQSPGCNFEI
jgi:hypothetical protein